MCCGLFKKKEKPMNSRGRKSIFSETWDPSEDDGEKIVIEKSPAQREWLKTTLNQIIIFKALDDEQLKEVIDAMEPLEVQKGQTIIRKGEENEEAMEFYVVERGVFTASITDGKPVRTYRDSGYFGELALMYNQPRSATVSAEGDGKLWQLDRKTFRRIVLRSAYEKRKMYEIFIKSVPILEALQRNELLNLIDCLQPRTYTNKEKIIGENEIADGMYFVEEGTVIVMKKIDGVEKQVNKIGRGGYFGELALITKKTRAASVYADGPVKLAFLDVQAFERLLGPCVTIMQRNAADYNKNLENAFKGT